MVQLASRDLACPAHETAVLLTFEREYSNTATLRYAVDGCGQRALYAEACDMSTCRYFLISRLSLEPGFAPAATPVLP